MQMDGNEILHRKDELRRAVSDLRDRGLTTAAKFAADLLTALPEVEGKAVKRKSKTPERGRSATDDDEDAFQSGKCLFDLKEYKRAAHALRKLQGPRAVFLRCYATYLLGESRKEEERLEAGGLMGSSQAVNKDSRQKPAQHALPGAAHKWAQYESSSALSGQQYPDAKRLTTLQALSAALQTVHSWQIAMALIMPLLTKWAAAGCAQGGASRWQSMQCSLADIPLLHLLLWHTLLIAAAVVYITTAGQSRSVKGSAAGTGLLASQPVRLLIGMMGAQQAVVRLEAGLSILNSLVDAVAVYTLMTALTCTVELQLGSRSWFSWPGHEALPAT